MVVNNRESAKGSSETGVTVAEQLVSHDMSPSSNQNGCLVLQHSVSHGLC